MHGTETTTTGDQVREALASWLKAFNAKDAEALFALYDPEAVYANDAAPLMRGLDEIRPWYDTAFETLTATVVFKEEAAFTGTDLALIAGKFYFKPAAEGEDQEPGETGRVVVVFRKAEDGRWLLVYDMDNRPPDVHPEDFS